MIKYSYKDKELKVPTGIGNNNNESFEEGYDFGYEEGFEVAYPSGYTDGFFDGHVSGVTEQKAKLVSTTITENGTYSREDGFNEVEVNVQPPLETLSVSQSGEVATYTPDDGYYGIGSISVNAGDYGSRRWQDGVAWKQERIAQDAIALSFSGNGEWQKDFFDDIYANRVVVNVPIDEIYQSGYTAGQKNPTLNYLWVRFSNYTHTWPSTVGISYIEFGDYYNHTYHGMFQFTIDSIEEEITANFDFEASGTCQYTGTVNYIKLITSTEMKDAIGGIDIVSINGIEFKPNRWEGTNDGVYIYFEPED